MTLFRTVILANYITTFAGKTGNGIAQPTITDTDIENIKKVGKRRKAFDILSNSLAPSIYGHDHIKKAVFLMLLGGMEKNLANGTHIRGYVCRHAARIKSVLKSGLVHCKS